jgi:hypothetical protein
MAAERNIRIVLIPSATGLAAGTYWLAFRAAGQLLKRGDIIGHGADVTSEGSKL